MYSLVVNKPVASARLVPDKGPKILLKNNAAAPNISSPKHTNTTASTIE